MKTCMHCNRHLARREAQCPFCGVAQPSADGRRAFVLGMSLFGMGVMLGACTDSTDDEDEEWAAGATYAGPDTEGIWGDTTGESSSSGDDSGTETSTESSGAPTPSTDSTGEQTDGDASTSETDDEA